MKKSETKHVNITFTLSELIDLLKKEAGAPHSASVTFNSDEQGLKSANIHYIEKVSP